MRICGREAGKSIRRHFATAPASRPAKGRNIAIAEWPTKSGPADYALFVGTRCIARGRGKAPKQECLASHRSGAAILARVSVRGRSRGYRRTVGETGESSFLVPFVFSANGRPYLKQIETESGIWFRDARKPANHRRALVDWPTPDGLQGMLEIDAEAAQAALKDAPFEFGFPLRPYQKRAIEAVEAELATGRRDDAARHGDRHRQDQARHRACSIGCWPPSASAACASSWTGALSGTQAAGEFATTRIVSAKTFADIFGLKGLDTVKPDPETKVHICTIQGLVKRVLYHRGRVGGAAGRSIRPDGRR